MKIDFFVPQANDGSFDIAIGENLDFKSVSGFDTAYLVQLLTDRRTNKSEVSIPRNRGGWIGDVATKQAKNYEIGSFIYLQNQARNTQSELNLSAAYAKQALDYFVSINAAKQVKATASTGSISGEIIIDANSTDKFSVLWKNVGNIGV